MFFRQLLHEDLGCASYVVADGGEAAVIDPKWEIEDYLELAEEHDLRVTRILETHNHADHVSGRGRLAAATGATIHVSAEAGVDFEHRPLADGDEVEVGGVRIAAIATPGHRPEHTAYLVRERARGDAPWLLVTGDSLFVGDLARPDLAVEPEEGARGLYRSLQRLLELDDFVEVWPGHVGGSLCGGAGMSEKPGSTIGFERRFNPLARIEGEEEFVRALTVGLAPQPPNFRRIVALNRGPLLTAAAPLEPLRPDRVGELVRAGAVLLDGRSPDDYNALHARGSLNVSMVRAAVGTRAAWVVDPEGEVVVTAAGEAEARRLGRMLEAVGFRRLLGVLEGGTDAWRAAGLEVGTTPSIDVAGLAARLGADGLLVLDVRERDEWEEGHVPGSIHVPYHDLRGSALERLRERAAEAPLAVVCSAGNRSSLAASLLRREGLDALVHVGGGGVADLPAHGVELARGG